MSERTWPVDPVTDWEAGLYKMVERLFGLQPAVERHNEMANILTGLMMTAELSEIEIPGMGRVTLQDGKLAVAIEPVATPRPFI